MAKPQIELTRQPFPYKKPEEYEYIFSNVTGKSYDDIVEMVKEEGCRWSADGKYIIDEFGDSYLEKKYLEVMEVIAC